VVRVCGLWLGTRLRCSGGWLVCDGGLVKSTLLGVELLKLELLFPNHLKKSVDLCLLFRLDLLVNIAQARCSAMMRVHRRP
jgi:hypothetical protein